MCLLAYFEATLKAHNINQICYCCQISLQVVVVNGSFSDNLTLLGVATNYFAGDGT